MCDGGARLEYEEQQLIKVKEHKKRILKRSPRRLVPASVKEKGAEWFDRMAKAPGADKAKNAGAAVLGATAAGAGKFMTRTGQLTTSDKRVIRAYTKKGHSVERLDDIRRLDLRAVDGVASFARLHYT